LTPIKDFIGPHEGLARAAMVNRLWNEHCRGGAVANPLWYRNGRVRFSHLADVPIALVDVCFLANSGHSAQRVLWGHALTARLPTQPRPAFRSGPIIPISLISLMVLFAAGGFFAGRGSAKLPSYQPDGRVGA